MLDKKLNFAILISSFNNICVLFQNKLTQTKKSKCQITTMATAKCIKAIGLAPNVEPRSLNCLFNQTETDRFSAEIATGKNDRTDQDDSN